jgi:hypothetical protein
LIAAIQTNGTGSDVHTSACHSYNSDEKADEEQEELRLAREHTRPQRGQADSFHESEDGDGDSPCVKFVGAAASGPKRYYCLGCQPGVFNQIDRTADDVDDTGCVEWKHGEPMLHLCHPSDEHRKNIREAWLLGALIVQKFVRPLRSVRDDVDSFVRNHFFGGGGQGRTAASAAGARGGVVHTSATAVLGVHIRGSDMIPNQGGVRPSAFLPLVKRFVNANGCSAHKGGTCVVFVATEDVHFRKQVAEWGTQQGLRVAMR